MQRRALITAAKLGRNPEREKVINFTAAHSPFFQAACASGQVPVLATGASMAGNKMARNPRLSVEYKLMPKDSPTSSAWPRARTRCARR
jgi:hypothetical protein